MAGVKQLRAWFFQLVSPVLRDDGTLGGVRLRKGDQPNQQTLENLAVSATFSKESSDRAKVSTGSSDLGTEQGLAVLATDIQARSNATQLSDRSLVVQPSQLPTVINSTGNQDVITNTISTFTGDALSITPDGTTTRNSYVGKLSTPFKTWFSATLNTINTNIAGMFIPLSGTVGGSPVTGPVELSAGTGLTCSTLAFDNSQGTFKVNGVSATLSGNASNLLKSVNSITPTNYSESFQTNALHESIVTTSTTSGAVVTNQTGSVLQSISGASTKKIGVDPNGVYIRTNAAGNIGFINADTLTTDRFYQFPDKSGTIALVSDLNLNTYNTTSITPNDISFSNPKVFTVDAGLSWKVGNSVRAYSLSTPTAFIDGKVNSYSGTTLSIGVDVIKGAGTGIIDWVITPGNSRDVTEGIYNVPTPVWSGTSTSTFATSAIKYIRGNGMIHATIDVSYTSTGGTFPALSLTLALPSYLTYTGTSLLYGTGMVYNISPGTGATDTPLSLEVGSSNPAQILIRNTGKGGVLPSGTQNIIGHISYPYNPSL